MKVESASSPSAFDGPRNGVVHKSARERLRWIARKVAGSTKFHNSSRSDLSSQGENPYYRGVGGEYEFPASRRYQRFSTSISDFFRDESLVCGAVSCFGLFLSGRTEYLLSQVNTEAPTSDAENADGSTQSTAPKRRKPDYFLAISLIVTILLIVASFFIFESGSLDEMNRGESGEYEDKDMDQNYDDLSWHDGWDDDEYPELHNRCHGVEFNEGRLRIGKARVNGEMVRTGLVLAYIFLLGIYGPVTRLKTRHAILRNRVLADRAMYGEDEEDILRGTLHEDHYDGVCSHALCGCYPVDDEESEEEYENFERGNAHHGRSIDIPRQKQWAADEEEEDRPFDEQQADSTIALQHQDEDIEPSPLARSSRHRDRSEGDSKEDFCQKCFGCFSACFFGRIVPCFCWWQCLSVCALAQEAREVKRLLPDSAQQVDYITHQPFVEYAPPNQKRVFMSKLAKGLWLLFLIAVLIIAALLIWDENNFTIDNALVLLITFFQSFVILSIVHCLYKKSYLSFDAVSKFFSAGFLIAIPTCFVLEVILIILISSVGKMGLYLVQLLRLNSVEEFLEENPMIFRLVDELLNAFLVAGMVEEFCKYYVFRMIDHPDLLFMGTYNDLTQRRQSNSSTRSRTGKSRIQGAYKDKFLAREKAAAVTIAMLSVAVGLACAENIVYVFLRSESNGDATEELVVLGIRSIFPVHPLCAAVQSVHVIRKHVEQHRDASKADSIGVGTIVGPAIMVHGCFDAILMIISTFLESTEDEATAEFLAQLAWASASFLMFLTFLWFVLASRRQRDRLNMTDHETKRASTSWANIGLKDTISSSSSSDNSR